MDTSTQTNKQNWRTCMYIIISRKQKSRQTDFSQMGAPHLCTWKWLIAVLWLIHFEPSDSTVQTRVSLFGIDCWSNKNRLHHQSLHAYLHRRNSSCCISSRKSHMPALIYQQCRRALGVCVMQLILGIARWRQIKRSSACFYCKQFDEQSDFYQEQQ